MTYWRQDRKISTVLALGILVMLVIIPLNSAHGQNDFLCPTNYDSRNRTIPLADQQESKSPTISKATCTYYDQASSKIVFEVEWSPSGKVFGETWCNELIKVENGIGEYQSKSHYVRISASGIQPTENDYAQDLMQLLFVVVKDDAKFCPGYKSEQVPQITEPQETQQTESIATSQENTTIESDELQPIELDEPSIEFPYEIIIIGIAFGIGFLVFRKVRRR